MTDDDGTEHSVTKDITVTAPPNVKPEAVIDVSTSDLEVTVSGTDSTDDDGDIVSYAWDFGDSGTSDEAEETHTYAEAGTYTIELTVTDDDGDTDTATEEVAVTAPSQTIAADEFDRSEATGFGSADQGGSWSPIGSAGNFAVSDGVGKIKMTAPAVGPRIYLNDVSAVDVDLSFDVAFDKAATGSGTYATVATRRVGNSEYRMKTRILPTSVQLIMTKVVDNTETTIASTTVPQLTYQAGDVLRLHVQVAGSGTTQLRAKVWRASSAEPAQWQLTTTDSTAELQRAGSIGLQAYLSGSATNAPVVASIDNLVVEPQE